MSDLIFYTNPMSRGRIVRWMLEEVGQPYETRLVDWADKPADFVAANPMAKVPVLVLDNGEHLVDSSAILDSVLEQIPGQRLLPGRARSPTPAMTSVDGCMRDPLGCCLGTGPIDPSASVVRPAGAAPCVRSRRRAGGVVQAAR